MPVKAMKRKDHFYKELSLALHPDQFVGKHAKLHAHLKTLELHDEPFKVLNDLNEKNEKQRNFWKNIIKNPMLLVDLLFDNPLQKNIRLRYAAPFDSIAMFFTTSISIGIMILAFATLTVALIPIQIAQALSGLILSIFTGGLYGQLIENDKLKQLEKDWSSYLKR